MNGVSKNKKMQMEILDVPKITNTARSHEDERRERIVAPKGIIKRKLSRTAGLDKKVIRTVLFYVTIVTAVALLRAFVGYDVANLGRKIQKKELQLKELKKEVERLDNKYVNSDDLKTKEQKAKEKGFSIPNNPTYIDLKN